MSLHATLHPSAALRSKVYEYGQQTPPILSLIDHDGGYLSLSVFPNRPVDEHRAVAEQLVSAVTEYAAAVAQWIALQTDASQSEAA
ncbi:hypothetical protein AB0M28_10735 [Streptomyces sp. NPDC051940]|uniref:hypothetical protein n=1 Tax=Streptomyces sp. NPDC051940 TaxID=3155675 RepID=UPI00342BBA17